MRYSKYKKADLLWVREIPEHWEIIRAKFIFTKMKRKVRDGDKVVTAFRDGEVTLRENRRKEGFTFSTKEIGYQGIRIGDLVIHEMDAFAGAIGVSDSNGKSTPVYTVCTPKKPADTRYYAYLLRVLAWNGYIQSLSKGIRQRSTSFDYVTFGNLGLPYIPLNEQRCIANFLDEKTKKIHTLIRRKQNEIQLIEEYRTTLINEAVTKGLNPDVLMKDSGIEWLGYIPQHWSMRKIKHITKKNKNAIKTGPFGSQLTNSDMLGTDIKVYTQRNVIDNNFQEGDKYISYEKFHKLRGFEIFPGDILITSRGTIGKCAIFPENVERGVLHPCLIRLQVDEDIVNKDYLIWFIQDSLLFQQSISFESNATTIDVIYSGTLKEVAVPVPPIDEQKRILNFLAHENNKLNLSIRKLEKQIGLLEEYRKGLITYSVIGKIDVRE